MRTTLNLDDDVFATVTALSQVSNESLGRVVSEALRRAFTPATITMGEHGLPVFSVPPGAKMITSGDIRRAEDEDDRRHAGFFA